MKVRVVRRGPEEERWDTTLLRGFTAPPWTEATEQMQGAAVATRRRYLTLAVVERLGQSANCPACQDLGGQHTARCRARLERLHANEEERLRDERRPRHVPAPEAPAPPGAAKRRRRAARSASELRPDRFQELMSVLKS